MIFLDQIRLRSDLKEYNNFSEYDIISFPPAMYSQSQGENTSYMK